jgi:hemoglobin/transferrin/lactoferrin receptor protein
VLHKKILKNLATFLAEKHSYTILHLFSNSIAMLLYKCIVISLFWVLSVGAYAQNEPIPMDRMDKTDLAERRSSTETRVVSASRSNHSIGELPIAIQVVTHEEIVRNGYVTLADVLKHISGIRVSKPGNGVDGETFLMRGLIGNYYTKILINSIPIQPSVSGSIAIAEHLPVVEADRIEIIFGPSSTIYGGDAMAGVVNIITKTTENNPFAQASVYTGEYGYRYGTFSAGGKAGRNQDVVRYSIYANFSERQDQNVRYDLENYSPLNSYLLDPQTQEVARQNPDQFLLALKENFPYYQGSLLSPTLGKMPQSSYMLGGQMEYRGFQASYLEMHRKSFYSTGLNPFTFSHHNPEAFYGDKIRRLTASYNKDWERWAITSNLSYNQYRLNNMSSRASTYDGFNGRSYKYSASDDIFAETLLRYSNKKRSEWIFGSSVQVSSALPETNDLETPFNPKDYKPFTKNAPAPHTLYGDFGYNPLSFMSAGLFAQWIRTGKRFTHVLGIRSDMSTLFTTGMTVRYATQYKVHDNLSLRFSAGRAFKIPAPNLTYSSTALPGDSYGAINYQQIPNKNLQIEFLTSTELGMRYQIMPNTFLEVIAYLQTIPSRINNVYRQIDLNEYPKAEANNTSLPLPFPVARSYKNDSSASSTLSSLQIIFKQQNLFRNLKLNIDASVTLSDGSESISEDFTTIDIKRYRMVPFFFGQFNVDFTPHKNWYVRLENVWSSKWHRRFIPPHTSYDSDFNTIAGYYTLDAVIRYKWSKHIDTTLKMLNVFNAQYGGIDATGFDIDLRYNPQLGRNVQLGVNFKLD